MGYLLCSYCEQPIYPSQKFCGSCGNEVVVQQRSEEPITNNTSNETNRMVNLHELNIP